MQGVDGHNGLEILHLFLAQHPGGCELAAVGEPMTDRGDFIHAVDHAPLRICQKPENERDCLVMSGHGVVGGIGRLAGTLMRNSAGQTDLFAQTLSQHAALVHIKQLIFQ